ncbi:phytoene/squalene synthase family protein [Olivibacter sitiensis]|uniref:phytoene/squalene synthase family protein n=1 Tax=Olivibacter sitiensis TaxID=376470 RepID=UPI00041C5E44|nr:phytoene/squalene synthase family protein [Olivibacter sitiensis]
MNTLFLFSQASFSCSHSVTRKYSTSFSSAIQLLHPDLRDPIMGIYGFVRLADEIVDTFHDFDKRALLEKFEEDTFTAIAQGISLNPILQSFQLVVCQYRIQKALISAFFRSMFTDLEKKEWKNEQELKDYIYGSAEVVGLMCLQVFCEGNEALVKQLAPAATALGSAFQKVNFLRDIRDDMESLDRQYFPNVDFNRFSAADKKSIEDDILRDFKAALRGIEGLPPKARFGVYVAYRYYLCLFQKIRSLPPEVVMKRRVRVPNMQKLLLVLRLTIMRKLHFT